jgi:hypothetical protein
MRNEVRYVGRGYIDWILRLYPRIAKYQGEHVADRPVPPAEDLVSWPGVRIASILSDTAGKSGKSYNNTQLVLLESIHAKTTGKKAETKHQREGTKTSEI